MLAFCDDYWLFTLLFLALLPGWWLAWRTPTSGAGTGQINGEFTWAMMTTLVVGSLITFRSATANQVILYLPLFFLFQRLMSVPFKEERWNMIAILLVQVGLAVLMWVVFMATLEGNWEHVMMHGLLPALLLLLYLVNWPMLRQTTPQERSQ